jgi:hypothetical protein
MSKHVATDFRELGRIVGADIEDFGLLFFGKRVEATAKIMTFPALPDASKRRFGSAL